MDFSSPPLYNKTALITGGSSGIGKELVRTFLHAGARVFFLCTNPDKRHSTLAELRQELPEDRQDYVQAELCDVANTSQCDEALAKMLALWGKVDILINNAGITRDGLLMRMNEKDWDDVLNTNLKSVYNLSHAVIRPMIKAKSGVIINVSSVIGLVGNEGQSNYAAAKAGMIGFSKSLAREVASRNIRVNCIAPGFIQTPMTQELSPELQKEILDKIPMGRFGKVEEISDLVLFLASDNSHYITGQTIAIDGGMTMQ